MKKFFRLTVCAVLLICTVLALGVFASAEGATTISGNISRDGVAYRLSADKKSYEVVGYSEHLATVTILPFIDDIPVTLIKESSFHNNSNVNTVVIPATVKTIEKAAFRNCENLTKVTFKGSIDALPEECFYECRMLSTINLPEGLAVIGDECFKDCTMLGTVKIPSTVTEIGHDAFLNCERLLLDVSANAYASDYAKAENLNTSFKNSSLYFFIVISGAVIIGIALFILISIPVKKHIKKHPSHNPAIYIESFFAHIGRFLGFIYNMIKKGVLFAIGYVIDLFELAIRKIRLARLAKKEEKSAKERLEEDDCSN